jgi:hypothetical protein
MGKDGTYKTNDNMIDGVHLVVPTPLTEWAVPSPISIVSFCVDGIVYMMQINSLMPNDISRCTYSICIKCIYARMSKVDKIA